MSPQIFRQLFSKKVIDKLKKVIIICWNKIPLVDFAPAFMPLLIFIKIKKDFNQTCISDPVAYGPCFLFFIILTPWLKKIIWVTGVLRRTTWFSGLQSPRWSFSITVGYSWVQTIFLYTYSVITPLSCKVES